jgi:hypothetical protein
VHRIAQPLIHPPALMSRLWSHFSLYLSICLSLLSSARDQRRRKEILATCLLSAAAVASTKVDTKWLLKEGSCLPFVQRAGLAHTNKDFTPVVRLLHTAGRRDVYAVAARHLWRREVSSEQGQVPWVIYDFACSLDEFTFNRNPGMASELRFFHDRWVAGSRRRVTV